MDDSIRMIERGFWILFYSSFFLAVLVKFLPRLKIFRPAHPCSPEMSNTCAGAKDGLPVAAASRDESATDHAGKETVSGSRPGRRSRDEGWKRIGQILLEQGVITAETLEKAVGHQRQYGGTITQFLLHYGYINEKQLAQCLSSQFKIPYLPLQSYEISRDVIDLVPVDMAHKYWLIPVDRRGDSLTVVMIDPLDTRAIAALEQVTGLKVIPFVGIISEIEAALRIHYGLFIKDAVSEVKTPFFIDNQTYKGAERRNSIRYKARIDVRFPAGGVYQKSCTLDVSRDGLSFESDIAVAAGEVLTMEFVFPADVSELPVCAVVQVVRCLLQANKRHLVGVKTLKADKHELAMIIKYASAFQLEEGQSG